MSTLGWAAAFALAAVLVWAAVAKLTRPDAAAASFEQLGLPFPDLLVRAVPAGELVTAVLLLAFPVAGAVAALVLLAGFSAVLAHEVRRGTGAPCACFGATRSAPISPRDLARNAVLAVAAGLVLAAHL